MRIQELLCATGLGMVMMTAGGCDVLNLDLQAAVMDGTFERTLTVDGPVDLDVQTGAGDIQIRAGSGNSVHVTGRIRVQSWGGGDTPEARVAHIQTAPPVEQTGNTVRLGRVVDNALYRNVHISYEVVVPLNTKVRAHTGSGDIGIAFSASDVNATTGSGDINVLGSSGSLMAHTGSGDVHAGKVAGPMTAETGSGDVDAVQLSAAPVSIRTGSGNVTLDVASDASFDLSVHTGSGSIQTSHPLTATGNRSRNRLEGTVRGGGPAVDIRTGSGDVRIN
jgi:Putative adhesin